MSSRIYLGHVMHARIEPTRHAFRYPAFVFALDVDELPGLDRKLRLFAHNRRGLFSLHEADYLGCNSGGLRDKLRRRLAASGAEIELDRIELVTTPRFVGQTFNPVSFFYCYAASARLSGVVVEVNNTFGEGHIYVLPAAEAMRGSGDDELCFVTPKRFHVSPFNDMRGSYEFRLGALTERLDVHIDIRRDGGKAFVSRLSGTARTLDDVALCRLAATYPLTTALTLPRILWQAYKLHYRKGLPVFSKPEPSSRQTFVATRPAYISEFSAPPRLRERPPGNEMEEDHGSH